MTPADGFDESNPYKNTPPGDGRGAIYLSRGVEGWRPMYHPNRRTPLLTAVTFDLWQTLIADSAELIAKRDQLRVSRMQAYLSRWEIQVTTGDLINAHDEVWRRLEELWDSDKDISSFEQALLFLSCLRESSASGPEGTGTRHETLFDHPSPEFISGLEHCYTAAVLDFPPTPIEGGEETLRALSERNIKIALICNTGRTPGYCLREILRRYGLLDHFNFLAFSNELLIRKPDARVFDLVLGKLGVRAENACHVGDSPDTDIRGAKGAGLKAVHFKRTTGDCDSGIRPDFTIESLPELIPIVEGLRSQ